MTQTLSQENISSGLKLFAKVLLKRSSKVPIEPMALTIEGFKFSPSHIKNYCDYLGFESKSLPLPYLFVASQNAQLELLLNERFPYKALGLVHRSIELEMPEPLDIHKAHDVALEIGKEIPHPKGVEFDVTARFMVEGVERAKMVNRYFCFKKQPEMESKPSPKPEFSHLSSKSNIRFNETNVRGYAKVSGDYNPIHLHALTAKPFGFKRPIAHGMFMLAKAISTLDLNTRYLKVSFHRPALLPIKLDLVADENTAFLINSDNKPVLEINWQK
ncbi:acyl dehydratase [Vibrio ishigakensis]|uniref:Acyl dehydratase n=1 Tax=Vibrio ishigakensis TaxID=1481914 RepID=A0A0B8NT09_9VIBR|nr:MaoC/PaaZ C-terminal domain-containing protein [Vibrio ishigakensis]GAM57011.1 acyl dehydratase [Vibrio ishigakensis]